VGVNGKLLAESVKTNLYQFQIKALSSLARLQLLNVRVVRLRRLNPRRLDFILDLELELTVIYDNQGETNILNLIQGLAF
jgi:hypothetical protein